jgi:hypothetical protein
MPASWRGLHFCAIAATLAALLMACSNPQASDPSAPPSVEPGTSHLPTASTSANDKAEHERTRTTVVEVFYGSGSRLVARKARVRLAGNPILKALALAASGPTEKGLRAVVPLGAVTQAGFDGIGRRGAFWVGLADARWTEPQPGMSAAEVDLAVRAVVCTVQSFGGKQPVTLYPPGGGRPVTRFLGRSLPEPQDNVMALRCPR